ncbi:hypothetical protein BDR04DRAFT_322851 [Suillus decipiens]|nr:hypothetical protein BDR04DRAFT_322851 [Suillus decipiens]
MSLILSKQPSVVTRLLEFDACPPHDAVHDIQHYPLYYDALHFPQYHVQVFASSDNFCAWLSDVFAPPIMSSLQPKNWASPCHFQQLLFAHLCG